MSATALAALRSAQLAAVAALQDEHMCDDLDAPPGSLGWEASALEAYYESGGTVFPEPAAAAGAASGPDGAMQAFLAETDLGHLAADLASLSWAECEGLYADGKGRPALLSHLGKLQVKLSDRQKLVNAFGKGARPDAKKGQAGGGRPLCSRNPPP